MMYFGHTNPVTLLPESPCHAPLTTPCPLVTHSPLNRTSAVHMLMGSGIYCSMNNLLGATP